MLYHKPYYIITCCESCQAENNQVILKMKAARKYSLQQKTGARKHAPVLFKTLSYNVIWLNTLPMLSWMTRLA